MTVLWKASKLLVFGAPATPWVQTIAHGLTEDGFPRMPTRVTIESVTVGFPNDKLYAYPSRAAMVTAVDQQNITVQLPPGTSFHTTPNTAQVRVMVEYLNTGQSKPEAPNPAYYLQDADTVVVAPSPIGNAPINFLRSGDPWPAAAALPFGQLLMHEDHPGLMRVLDFAGVRYITGERQLVGLADATDTAVSTTFTTDVSYAPPSWSTFGIHMTFDCFTKVLAPNDGVNYWTVGFQHNAIAYPTISTAAQAAAGWVRNRSSDAAVAIPLFADGAMLGGGNLPGIDLIRVAAPGTIRVRSKGVEYLPART